MLPRVTLQPRCKWPNVTAAARDITLLKLKHGSIIVFLNADITSLFTALIKAVYPSCEDKAQGPLLSDGDPP